MTCTTCVLDNAVRLSDSISCRPYENPHDMVPPTASSAHTTISFNAVIITLARRFPRLLMHGAIGRDEESVLGNCVPFTVKNAADSFDSPVCYQEYPHR